MATVRDILHVDMDAFFASIEQLDHPELRGKPVLVGSDRPRGVVAAASYEARRYRCHSALPMAVALRRCPDAAVMPVRGARYREVSGQVFDLFARYTDLVEPLSIDEAFLDVTGSRRLFGAPRDIAAAVKREVRDQTGLTASVGVAPNKFLAKLASDMDKPDGLTVVDPERVLEWLHPMPVSRIWGVGPAAAHKLETMGVRTIGDLAARSEAQLERYFGSDAGRLHRLCRGLDTRPVTPDHAARSISHERTFEVDLEDADAVRSILMSLVEQVARRLRKHERFARTITLKIRYGDFETITRSSTLPRPSNATDELWGAARDTFDRWAATSFQPVRLIGAAAGNLGGAGGQLDLFDDPAAERHGAIDEVADKIVGRFGKNALHRGGSIG